MGGANMSGWISLHRKIQDHEIFNEKRVYSKFEAWIYFLLNANHKEGKSVKNSNVITIKRGQLLTSKKKLREIFGWSNTKLNKFIEVLEVERMIHTKSTSKYTVITIENYDFYQSDEGRKHSKKITETHQKNIRNTSETHQKHTNNNDNNELIRINNENNTTPSIENRDTEYRSVIEFLERCGFGNITPNTYEDIKDWIELLNVELVLEAIKIADHAGKNFWNYPRGILRKWSKANLKTLEQVKVHERKENYVPGHQRDTVSDIKQKEWQKQYGEHLDKIMQGVDIDNVPF